MFPAVYDGHEEILYGIGNQMSNRIIRSPRILIANKKFHISGHI